MANGIVLRNRNKTLAAQVWMRSALLLPIWGAPVTVIVGTLAMCLGPYVTHGALIALTLAFCVLYAEDLLKRKVRIKDGFLYFGYRKFDLSRLRAFTVEFADQSMIPSNLVLIFEDARKLTFPMDSFNADDFETLVRLLENKYPRVRIDPVLGTLTRCRTAVDRQNLDTGTSVEIGYNSQRVITELQHTLKDTAGFWSRLGPLLVFLLCSPIWLTVMTQLLTVTKYVLWNDASPAENYKEMIDGLGGFIAGIIETTARSAEGGVKAASNPFLLLGATSITAAALVRAVSIFFSPNRILATIESVALCLNDYRLRSIKSEDVKTVRLVKKGQSPDPSKWYIEIAGDNDTLSLRFDAIDPRDRERLLRAIQKFCLRASIDAELSQALMPRKDRSYTELWLQSLSTPQSRRNLEPLKSGATLQEGQYEVLRTLGVGGQGMAYLCRELSSLANHMSREVVLKETVMPVFVDDTVRHEALSRFEREARLLQKLDDDRVVRLVDFFLEDHRGYLVLEHISGKNLREYVHDNGPIDEQSARKLAGEMCEILTYIHGENVIHRDFTPDNLILTPGQTLKLIDFNVAQESATGKTGTIVGKHAYIPPEQLRGKATVRSDIYAMGATLYYLLTGQDPVPLSEADVCAVRKDISAGFESVIKGCTALQESKRFQSIQEVIDALGEEPEESIVIPLKESVLAGDAD